jgi:hypothetical protein
VQRPKAGGMYSFAGLLVMAASFAVPRIPLKSRKAAS